jgi:hypothetical protein
MITPETAVYSCQNSTNSAYYREAEFNIKTPVKSGGFPVLLYACFLVICISSTIIVMGKANEARNKAIISDNQALKTQITTFEAQKAAYCQN